MTNTTTINPFDKTSTMSLVESLRSSTPRTSTVSSAEPLLRLEEVNGEQSRTIKCAFCQGKGKDPFELLSELATCQVCNGKGKVNVALPYNSCPFCGGSGVKPHSRLVCTICTGKGVISHQKGGKDCPACAGSGKNSENDLPCSTCGGSGKTEGTKKNGGDKV